MTASAEPRGFADSQRELRRAKARKIEHLLGGAAQIRGRRLLDLGAGAGFLAEHFAHIGAEVTAADRDAEQFAARDVAFTPISGTQLPFDDGQFDLIIFNHVIEHVGERRDQAAMLDEIKRCLAPAGTLYLAVPNLWALMEPHYRLPLLGALPQGLADTLVRRFRDHDRYDCRPFARTELLRVMRARFGTVEDRSANAFQWAVDNELDGAAKALLRLTPDWMARAASGIYPTLILTARH